VENIQLVLSIISVVLLALTVILLLMGKKRSDISEIISLLKTSSEEQRESIDSQLSDGATDQFRRFSMKQ
jgi:hypothetical protein